MNSNNNPKKRNDSFDLDAEINQLLKAEKLIRKIRQAKEQEQRKQLYKTTLKSRTPESSI